MRGFPPQSVYPTALDTDRTLYVVYNTSETTLSANNAAWSEEISIVPSDPEVWADNGFATIEGEILYYDSVEKNASGSIIKFKRCLRNLGGKQTQFNPAGTWIRGFIMAEHHEQLVEAIINTQSYIGMDGADDEDTLDNKISVLDDLPPVFDDSGCPDVQFDFEIVSESSSTGTVAEYNVAIQGAFGSFEVQFGDGNKTTSASGTHAYAPNATIDPVVIVSNGNCQIVQTPPTRVSGGTVTTQPKVTPKTPPFTVPIPLVPDFPNLNFPSVLVPSSDINLPPIIFPSINIPTSLPSLISILLPNLQIPSLINFGPLPTLPSNITITGSFGLPSEITFTNVPSFGPIGFGPAPSFGPIGFGPIPTLSVDINVNVQPLSTINVGFGPVPSFEPILFGPSPSFGPIGFGPVPSFGPIGFGPVPSFSPILFGPAPSFGPIGFGPVPSFSPIGFGPAPSFEPIGFGPVPSFSPILFGPVPSFEPIGFGPVPSFSPILFGPAPSFGPIGFGPAPAVTVNWGTPPSITCACTITCPSTSAAAAAMNAAALNNFPLNNQIDPGFENIELQYDMVGFPSEIKVTPPDIPPIIVQHDIPQFISVEMPSEIRVIGTIPEEIRIVLPDMEGLVNVFSLAIPKIEIDAKDMPTRISVAFPEEMPMISFDASTMPDIRVVGIPETIRIEHTIPSVISFAAPDFKIPLVFDGPPLTGELKINWGFDRDLVDEDKPCFQLVPCPKR